MAPTDIGTGTQVAAGNYRLEIGGEHGAFVHPAPPEGQPAPRLRSLPILQRPGDVRLFLDRQEDVAAALTAIGTALPVGVHGPPGIGKSTLLRHLAHAPEAGALPDGVVHLDARGQPAEDLLQSLFEAFYQCEVPFRATRLQTRQFLRGRRALVLLDDGELKHEEAEDLLACAPDCGFVMATRERCLWRECQSVGLGGLPAPDARALFERELGRALTMEETPAFESLNARLEGHPLRLLQAAAQLRRGKPIAEAAPVEEATARQTLAPLPDEEKRLLSALAAVGGGPLEAGLLAALADVADPLPALEALLDLKLIQAHSPRYSLTGDLDTLLPSIWDISPWCKRALAYFLSWAEARREDPAALLEEAGTLRHLLDWAARNGHHAETLRLGRVLDAALIVSGRWGAWGQSLERVRDAAAAIGDRAAEAWALHQLGTRLLCLDDKAAARPLLSHALALRQSLGDGAGAEATSHNLGLLGPLTYALPGRLGRYSIPYRLLPWLAIALLILIVGGIRLVSSQMRTRSLVRDTDVPISSDFGSLPESTPIPSASIEESPEPTTDKTETAPSDTSDQSEDESESGLLLDTTDGIGFHPPETEERAPEEPREEPAEETPAPPVRQGWCCSGGEVSLSSEPECKDRQGGFFLRQRPALAACLITGCCADGSFKLGEKRERCDEQGGTFMAAIEVPFRCKAP